MSESKSSEFVTLVSNDGYEFKILRSAACIAGTIKKALDPMSGFREQAQNRVDLPMINGVVLEKVCEYLYYNQKHAESKDVPDMDIQPELCLELLIAADYLDGEWTRRGTRE
ncbi:elongin C [Kalmusia sp. IMI 367209]|nr:elongin C [Kalmusia sp. IMI 367209]